jgi:hypothetical protein
MQSKHVSLRQTVRSLYSTKLSDNPVPIRRFYMGDTQVTVSLTDSRTVLR